MGLEELLEVQGVVRAQWRGLGEVEEEALDCIGVDHYTVAVVVAVLETDTVVVVEVVDDTVGTQAEAVAVFVVAVAVFVVGFAVAGVVVDTVVGVLVAVAFVVAVVVKVVQN